MRLPPQMSRLMLTLPMAAAGRVAVEARPGRRRGGGAPLAGEGVFLEAHEERGGHGGGGGFFQKGSAIGWSVHKKGVRFN